MSNSFANYDAIKLYVDPNELKRKLKSLSGEVENVVSDVNDIQNTFTDLKLGWAGGTAKEADDFSAHWNSTMKELFGTKDNPSEGVLNAMMEGLATAASGYAITEQTIFKMFQDFNSQLGGGGQPSTGTPSTPPENIADTSETAITETW